MEQGELLVVHEHRGGGAMEQLQPAARRARLVVVTALEGQPVVVARSFVPRWLVAHMEHMASGAMTASGGAVDHDVIGRVDEEGRRELAVCSVQQVRESLRLGERSRESVQQEAIGRGEPRTDHVHDEPIGHERP